MFGSRNLIKVMSIFSDLEYVNNRIGCLGEKFNFDRLE